MDRKGEKLFSIEGAPPDLRVKPKGCPFAPRCIYRIDRCLEENPILEPVQDGAPGHIVACWVDVREGVPTA
jgi:oligopeptide/dipeptide ABC transporter ATP-binding protein